MAAGAQATNLELSQTFNRPLSPSALSPLSNYKLLKVVGRGNFGVIHLGEHVDGKLYVMKEMRLDELSESERQGAQQEAMLLRQLKHPCIVTYKESWVETNTLYLVMRYCSGGDLTSTIRSFEERDELISEEQVLSWFVQIALAMRYCHSHNILHRDLKTQNVFLTRTNQIKVGDFGIARVLEGKNDLAMSVVGTPYSMSPEVCENKPYSFASDVWSLGCILYEMCVRKHAFDANNLLGLVWKIVQENYPPLPECYSEDLRNLIGEMLRKDPAARPTVEAIIKRDFIRKHIYAMSRKQTQLLARRHRRQPTGELPPPTAAPRVRPPLERPETGPAKRSPQPSPPVSRAHSATGMASGSPALLSTPDSSGGGYRFQEPRRPARGEAQTPVRERALTPGMGRRKARPLSGSSLRRRALESSAVVTVPVGDQRGDLSRSNSVKAMRTHEGGIVRHSSWHGELEQLGHGSGGSVGRPFTSDSWSGTDVVLTQTAESFRARRQRRKDEENRRREAELRRAITTAHQQPRQDKLRARMFFQGGDSFRNVWKEPPSAEAQNSNSPRSRQAEWEKTRRRSEFARAGGHVVRERREDYRERERTPPRDRMPARLMPPELGGEWSSPDVNVGIRSVPNSPQPQTRSYELGSDTRRPPSQKRKQWDWENRAVPVRTEPPVLESPTTPPSVAATSDHKTPTARQSPFVFAQQKPLPRALNGSGTPHAKPPSTAPPVQRTLPEEYESDFEEISENDDAEGFGEVLSQALDARSRSRTSRNNGSSGGGANGARNNHSPHLRVGSASSSGRGSPGSGRRSPRPRKESKLAGIRSRHSALEKQLKGALGDESFARALLLARRGRSPTAKEENSAPFQLRKLIVSTMARRKRNRKGPFVRMSPDTVVMGLRQLASLESLEKPKPQTARVSSSRRAQLLPPPVRTMDSEEDIPEMICAEESTELPYDHELEVLEDIRIDTAPSPKQKEKVQSQTTRRRHSIRTPLSRSGALSPRQKRAPGHLKDKRRAQPLSAGVERRHHSIRPDSPLSARTTRRPRNGALQYGKTTELLNTPALKKRSVSADGQGNRPKSRRNSKAGQAKPSRIPRLTAHPRSARALSSGQ